MSQITFLDPKKVVQTRALQFPLSTGLAGGRVYHLPRFADLYGRLNEGEVLAVSCLDGANTRSFVVPDSDNYRAFLAALMSEYYRRPSFHAIPARNLSQMALA